MGIERMRVIEPNIVAGIMMRAEDDFRFCVEGYEHEREKPRIHSWDESELRKLFKGIRLF